MSSMWDYRDSTWTDGHDLAGYDVEATDGSIGNVDQATNDVSNAYVVVDTGFWIFGKKRLIPAGAISSVVHDDKKVHVAMTKDQIKGAPDYDAEQLERRLAYPARGLLQPLQLLLRLLRAPHPRRAPALGHGATGARSRPIHKVDGAALGLRAVPPRLAH